MKKSKCLVLLSSIYIVFCWLPSSAITIDINPNSQQVQIGDAVEVEITISGLAAANEIVSTYDLDISYDPKFLSATDVIFGEYLDDLISPGFSFQSTILTTSGVIDFAEESLLPDAELAAQQPDSFALATLFFTAQSQGTSELLLIKDPNFGIDVKGRNAQILALDVGPASVINITAASIPEPSILWLILIAIPGLLFTSRHRRIK